jgi:serine/alanine adding enzyme
MDLTRNEQIIVSDPATNDGFTGWNEFVLAQPVVNPFHLAQWHEILNHVFQVQPLYRMGCDATGRILGIVPAYFASGLFATPQVATLDGGILSADQRVADSLHAELSLSAGNLGARHVMLKGGAAATGEAVGGSVFSKRIYPVVDLSAGVDFVTQRLNKKMRYQIKKSQALGLEAVQADQVPHSFYAIFARTQRDLGTPVVSRKFFDSMNAVLSPLLNFTGLMHHGRLVAGLVGVSLGDTYYSLYAATDREYQHNYANYLLYLRVMEWACERQLGKFNMGRSSPGTGAYRYKTKWRPVDIEALYRCDFVTRRNRPKDSAILEPASNSIAVKVWKRMPLTVTNVLGPSLRSRLPFG